MVHKELKSTSCPKLYKTKSGLSRHVKAKHSILEKKFISIEELKRLIDEEIRNKFSCEVEFNYDLLYEKMNIFSLEWQEHPHPDSYYSKYQKEIVNVHQKYFQLE